MPKRRFDFTKKNKRSGKVENVGYLDLEQDEEHRLSSLPPAHPPHEQPAFADPLDNASADCQ